MRDLSVTFDFVGVMYKSAPGYHTWKTMAEQKEDDNDSWQHATAFSSTLPIRTSNGNNNNNTEDNEKRQASPQHQALHNSLLPGTGAFPTVIGTSVLPRLNGEGNANSNEDQTTMLSNSADTVQARIGRDDGSDHDEAEAALMPNACVPTIASAAGLSLIHI